ncbi:hypothetical protein AT959_05680 [Dechloromonas denitrificans]|uniref:Uncharacterized protein n=1 Tax=Dechloromonas denitrificans TaxID=281362 RepID=A0A133XLL7_9RHOO|nr:hypothetical protein [Dechloromonas denitrificans]KXB31833.1 hypothetical protein AT959_05680 [Dechloromonas denitrificans]
MFRALGGGLLTFAIVWALVLGWWQSNDHEPSKSDLALYLAALPLALIGGYWLFRVFVEHLKAPPSVAMPSVAATLDDDPLSSTKAKTAAAERSFTHCLIDAFVVAAPGTSADDLLSAVDAGKRPEPSFRVTDENGFPVFLAEVSELDVDDARERLEAASESMRQVAEYSGVVRALALLERLLDVAREPVERILQQDKDGISLRVLWMIPADWPPSCHAVLRSWLQLNHWPALGEGKLEIALQAAVNEVDAMRLLDEAVLRVNRGSTGKELTLLLGAASNVDELTVSNWAAANSLFSAQHQQRKIPGEGAAALLLASRATVEHLGLSDVVVISRASIGTRDKSLDAGGRIGGKLIEQLVAGLLDALALESSRVKTVIFDSDHRSNHIAEAMEGVGQDFEHLEPVKDCLATGTVHGALQPIGSLLALACARSKVLLTEAPALCVSNQHELDRAVVLVMPFASQVDTKSSPT